MAPRSQPGRSALIFIFFIAGLILLSALLALFFSIPGASRLLSAQALLDYEERGETGVGQYYLFFRHPPREAGNVITDDPNIGDGTLPTSEEQLEAYFLEHPEELAAYKARNESHDALSPDALEDAALAAGEETLEQCEILPRGTVIEPWWRTAN